MRFGPLIFAASLALLLVGGIVAGERVRDDLTPEDLARVEGITTPNTDFSKPEKFEAMSGGAATSTKLINRDAFSNFSANLTFAEEERFKLGNALFRKLWTAAPSSTLASDGLGPLFNARGCQSCGACTGIGIFRQQAGMRFGDVKHNGAGFEQDEIVFLVGRYLTEGVACAMHRFLHCGEGNRANFIELSHLFERPTDARVPRQPSASVRRPREGRDDGSILNTHDLSPSFCQYRAELARLPIGRH
jgi:hypothetical protein